jgi:hypothetical protein
LPSLPPPAAPAAPAAPRPLPAAIEEQRQRALAAALDALRLSVSALFWRVAEGLTAQPSQCTLAMLEGEVQDALARLGGSLLTELVGLRGTGDLGPTYTCPCGVRLERQEVAPLVQRTWFGPITLTRTVYAGTGCRVRAHQVPVEAAWGLLGTTPAPTPAPAPTAGTGAGAAAAILPDPDGGVLAPAAPGKAGDGTGKHRSAPRLAPGFAAVVVEFGTRLAYDEAAHLLEVAYGAVAHLAPNTIRTYTRAAGRAREQQEQRAVAQQVRTTPPSQAQVRDVVTTPLPPRPAAAPETLVVSVDGALERTRAGWKEVKLGAIAALVKRGTATTAAVLGPKTYTATLAPAQTFGRQLLAAAQRRGLGWAHQVVILGDGASCPCPAWAPDLETGRAALSGGH